MRPLKLEMQGFLTYKNKEIIDFEKLGQKGIYLISGKTGTGKTAIFDAIMYALYGSGSSDDRAESEVRSSFASEDDDTYVKLLFESDGKQYEVRRNPGYRGPSERGGYRENKPNAVLTYFDGTASISGKKNVDEKLREILGIERDQFKNIVMISQGEFAKFLKASTDQKEKIFRNIFGTSKFEELQTLINNDFKANNKNKSEGNIKLQEQVKMIICDEDSDINLFKENKEFNEAVISLIELQNNEDKESLTNLKEAITVSRKSQEVNTKAILEANKAENTKKELKEAEDAKKSSEVLLKKKEEEKVEFCKQEASIKVLEKEKTIIESQLGKYEILSSQVKVLNELTQFITHYPQTKAKLETDYQKALELQKKEKEELEALANVEVDFTNKKNEKEKVQDSIRKIKELKNEFKDFNNKQAEKDQCAKRTDTLFKDWDQLSNEYKELLYRFNSAQAGILANNLKKEEAEKKIKIACPVCGSLEHPSFAVLTEEIDETIVKNKETESLNAQQLYNKQNAKLQSLAGELSVAQKGLLLKAQELLNVENLDTLETLIKDQESKLNEAFNKAVEECDALSKKVERKKHIQMSQETTAKNVEQTFDALNKANTDYEVKAGQVESQKQHVTSLQKELAYDSKEQAEAAIKEKNDKVNAYNQYVEDLKEVIEKQKQKVSELTGNITTLKKNLESLKVYDLEALNKEKEEIASKIIELEKKEKDLNHKVQTNSDVYKNLKALYASQKDLLDKITWLKELDDVYNAKVTNESGKIRLETYVQTYYFDRVLVKANKRLLAMSDDQYELIRRSEKKNDNQTFALDLLVVDNYTNSKREASVLSGGESFKASLALALGLSDMIQELAMTKKLDCMFIDEGFGSLDNEGSLQAAIRELSKLSDGDRLIGIISHVEALKDMLSDNMIAVSKTAQGYSQTKIITQ